MRILISGASIAGPVLAYWLSRNGFDVTLIERAPELRRTGGHAVDLFRPATEISRRMGVLPSIQERVTGTTQLTLVREGARRPVHLDLSKIFDEQHAEIMRDDLSEVYNAAVGNDVEYLFGDSITAITADGETRFERAASRRFDLVIGADGLHSNVRRLVFGDRQGCYLGAGFATLDLPRPVVPPGELRIHVGVDRTAGIYGSRALFLFRRERETYDRHDIEIQKKLVRTTFTGLHPDVDHWLDEDGARDFYCDSITQLTPPAWSQGRVALIGDAAYSPGPVVGGSTSLAVIGAYTLARELIRADGEPERAFPAYENAMADHVSRSHAAARRAAKKLVPRSRWGVYGLAYVARLVSALPPKPSAAVLRLTTRTKHLYDTMTID